MRISLLPALALLLLIQPALQAQPAHRNSPILCFLQGRYPRNPVDYPKQERLASYRFYWIKAVDGRKVGDLTPMGQGAWPTFRIVGTGRASRGSLHLTRPERSGWLVRNEQLRVIGRIRRLRSQAGEYDWRNLADASIGALIPVSGSLYYEVRGGDELKALFEERWKVPLTAPATLRVETIRERFRALHRGVE